MDEEQQIECYYNALIDNNQKLALSFFHNFLCVHQKSYGKKIFHMESQN